MEILQVIHFCSHIYIPARSDPSRNIYITSLNTFIPSSGTFGFYIWVQVEVFEDLFSPQQLHVISRASSSRSHTKTCQNIVFLDISELLFL